MNSPVQAVCVHVQVCIFYTAVLAKVGNTDISHVNVKMIWPRSYALSGLGLQRPKQQGSEDPGRGSREAWGGRGVSDREAQGQLVRDREQRERGTAVCPKARDTPSCRSRLVRHRRCTSRICPQTSKHKCPGTSREALWPGSGCPPYKEVLLQGVREPHFLTCITEPRPQDWASLELWPPSCPWPPHLPEPVRGDREAGE